MRNFYFCLVLIQCSNVLFAQKSIIVIDKADRKPIQNITFWVKNNPVSFTTDKKGVVDVDLIKPECNLYIKSPIYKDYNVSFENLPSIIYLEQKDSVKDKTITLIMDETKSNKIDDTMEVVPFCVNKIYAKWFKNSTKKQIKNIKIKLNTFTEKTVFKVRFFNADTLQNPTTDFFEKDLVIKTSRVLNQKQINTVNPFLSEYQEIVVNVNDLNILTPDNNFFLGIELLQNDDNQYLKNRLKHLEKSIVILSSCLSPALVFSKVNKHDTMYFSGGFWFNGDSNLHIDIEYVE